MQVYATGSGKTGTILYDPVCGSAGFLAGLLCFTPLSLKSLKVLARSIFQAIHNTKEYDLKPKLCHSPFALLKGLEASSLNKNPLSLSALRRVSSNVISRPEQAKFRKEVLCSFSNKCAISGWGPEDALEAAHIHEYSASGSNNVRNGLALRVDLHRLFDKRLIKINLDFKVELDSSLKGTEYWQYHGTCLRKSKEGVGLEYLKRRIAMVDKIEINRF